MLQRLQTIRPLAPTNYLPIVTPLLAALVPMIFLGSRNVGEFSLSSTLIPGIIVLLGTVVLTIVLRLLVRDLLKAGLIATIWIILFFSYAAILDSINSLSFLGFHFGRQRYLLLVITIAAILALWSVARSRSTTFDVTRIFATILGVLVAVNLVILVSNNLGSGSVDSSKGKLFNDSISEVDLSNVDTTNLPDIYYIILDSYPRADILSEFYDYDNSPFLNSLRDLGFFVADKSTSNYVQSIFSMSSSLNLQYLDEYVSDIDIDSEDASVLQELIHDNNAYVITNEIGYRFAFLRSYATYFLSNPNADVHLTPSTYPLKQVGRYAIEPILGSSFGSALIRTSALRGVVDQWLGTTWARLFTQNIAHLKTLTDLPEPVFTFAHIYQPQMPYVFDRFGNVRNLPLGPSMEKAREGWADKESYVGQLIHVNNSMLESFDLILEKSKGNSVIVVQGDHGTAASADRTNLYYDGEPSAALIKERTSILNAIHLPESCDSSSLYDSISPVNIFRVIFDSCFGTAFGLLEDQTYWASYDRPFDLTPINELSNFSPN